MRARARLSPFSGWLLAGCCGLWLVAASAFAYDPRASLIDTYQHGDRSNTFYAIPPLAQTIPDANAAAYALQLRYGTVTVPDLTAPASASSLKIAGYSIAPYVAFSLKRVGLGFGVDMGQQTLSYLAPGCQGFTSTLAERGIDANAFVKAVDSQFVTLSLLAGIKETNFTYALSQSAGSCGVDTAEPTSPHNFNDVQLGVNLGIHLVKAVTLTPWVSHEGVNAAGVAKALNASDVLRGDLQVYLPNQPTAAGIDLSLRWGAAEIHLGDLFGLFVTAGKSSFPAISDHTYRLSIVWHQKN